MGGGTATGITSIVEGIYKLTLRVGDVIDSDELVNDRVNMKGVTAVTTVRRYLDSEVIMRQTHMLHNYTGETKLVREMYGPGYGTHAEDKIDLERAGLW